ncbi:MAG: transcription antitermination factor NusB [Desulfobacterales bacterium]
MSSRRRSRELALQALFFMDVNHAYSQEMLDRFCANFTPAKKEAPFFFHLVEGVIRSVPDIDAIIVRFSSNWKIGRMSGTDRNIMRIAAFEMLFCNDIPAKVSINEAIDVGKKFGSEESGAFINGILDSIRLAFENGECDSIIADTGAGSRQSDRQPVQPDPEGGVT